MAYAISGEAALAFHKLQEGVALLASYGIPECEVQKHRVTARVLAAQGLHEKALDQLRQAKDLATRTELRSSLIKVLRDLTAVQESEGLYREALASTRELMTYLNAQTERAARLRSHWFNAQLDLQQAQHAAELQRIRTEQLERDNRLLREQARADPLTGLANRRAFDAAMAERLTGLSAAPALLVIADIDHFKQINDQHSHIVGDAVLQRVGAVLRSSCRTADLAARIGGEEFALLVEGATHDAAMSVCDRIRGALSQIDWGTLSVGLTVTASFGVTSLSVDDTPTSAAERADAALYAAKRAGRNRVCVS